MLLADFDFELPESRIALRPAVPRDAARLLVVGRDGALADRIVRDLPSLLAGGDALVFNDSRVIPARLVGIRRRSESIVRIEATLLSRLDDWRWRALAKPGRRLAAGDRIEFGEGAADRACLLTQLAAEVTEKGEGGEVTLAFDLSGPDLDLAIAERGWMPLPPYIASRRPADAQDRTDYQTVYAREDGSVAAPTAGLHFTPGLMAALEARGVALRFLTLHVGAGTFLPVKTAEVDAHVMHAEAGAISAETAEALNRTRADGGRIVAVGTTALRLLESAADEHGRLRPFSGETSIFITPGYDFRVADGLLTNFHLPRSTLYMLVSAFSGLEAIRRAYAHAIADGYRFYSYGDASLLWRAPRS
jgi:S-adenosylmethionine:tRNA ribosyltransferase-isomerase